MEDSEEICTKLLHHGKVIAAAHGNMVVTVTSGDGIFGLTLRENKPKKKDVLMPRRGAAARKRRTEKRLLARMTSANENENAEISVLENEDNEKLELGESPSLLKSSTPTPEQNQTTNSSKAEEKQHLHDNARLYNRNVDSKRSNAGDDQVRIEGTFWTQKTFCIKQTS